MAKNIYKIGKELFVTSDVEIKEGDYVYFPISNEVLKIGNDPFESSLEIVKDNKDCKKIILTTDPKLIADGVQVIDDEFLEWFVKNPSCEEVETYSLGIQNVETGESGHYKYEIIIPKEEPKQETSIVEGLKDILAHITKMNSRHEKQETLEEAAERIYPIHIKSIIDKYDDGITNVIGEEDINEDNRESFINGAKWQQERSYSEEEVFNLCREFAVFVQRKRPSYKQQQEWFEQFKKE